MVRIPSSRRATNSPSASLRCNHAKRYLLISKVPSQARCPGKAKPGPLAVAFVEGVSPWVEAEADSPDHPALEATASLVHPDPEDHLHISLARE